MSRTAGNVLVFGPPLHRGIGLRSFHQSSLEMSIQSAVTCSEVKDGSLLMSWQLMECILVLVVSCSLAVEDGFLIVMGKSFDFSVGQM